MGQTKLLWGVYHDKDIDRLREYLKVFDGRTITILIEEIGSQGQRSEL